MNAPACRRFGVARFGLIWHPLDLIQDDSVNQKTGRSGTVCKWLCSLAAALMLWMQTAGSQDLVSMKFDVLDQSQGLAGNWITDLALDSSGFVWVSTREGLSRFDGHSFVTFRNKLRSPATLYNDQVQHLRVSPDGTLWLSYAAGYFSRYRNDCRCFEHLILPEARAKTAFDKDFGIKYIDRSGNLWFSGNGLGLNILNPVTRKTEHWDLPGISVKVSATDAIENNTVHDVYLAGDGLYWLATQHGLYSFDRRTGSFTFYPVRNSNPLVKEKASFNRIIPEGTVGFWISSWEGGLNYFDKSSGSFTNYLFENKAYGYYNLIYDMAEKNPDELYLVAGDRGLGIFNKRTGKLEFNKKLQNKLNPSITFLIKMLRLPDGVIFLADQTTLLKYNPVANQFVFNSLRVASSQHGDLFSIRRIQRWPGTGEYLFAADLGDGLNIIQPATGAQTAFPIATHPEKDPKRRIRNLLFDVNNRLWIISRDYIYYMDRVSGPMVRVPGIGGAGPVEYQQGYVAPNGDIWVLMKTGTLHRLNISTGMLGPPLTQPNGGRQPLNISHAAFGRQSQLWIISQGVLQFVQLDGGGVVKQKPVLIDELKSGGIKGMQADESGGVWLAVNHKGLVHVKVQRDSIAWRTVKVPPGLSDDQIFGMGIDATGQIWISVLSGILRYHPDSSKFIKYGPASGMEKFTMSMNFFSDNRGDFYITSLSKYCRVDLQNISRRPKPPEIYLDAFRVFEEDRKYSFDKHTVVELAPGEDFFTFNFGCLDFGDQSTHRFYYMLEGWDAAWVNAGSARHAGYTNLPEGDYVFKVKMQTEQGLESNTIAVPVKIRTYFYRKSWFLMLSATLLALGIFMLYLRRIRRIRRNEAMKAKLNNQIGELRMEAMRSQMNPHFIFNSLNSINRYIIKNDPKTSSLYLTRFATLMRMVLDNSRHKTISLEKELETLKLYIELEAFRFDRKFEFVIEVDEQLLPEVIQVPPLIIQPFVENAIWHGLMHADRPGKLFVGLYPQDGVLLVEIRDNGVGRQKSAEMKSGSQVVKTSQGMNLTRERINLVNRDFVKDIEITDLYDDAGLAAGTKVLLYLNCLND